MLSCFWQGSSILEIRCNYASFSKHVLHIIIITYHLQLFFRISKCSCFFTCRKTAYRFEDTNFSLGIGRGLRPRNIKSTTGSPEPTLNKRFKNRKSKKKYIQIKLPFSFRGSRKSQIMLAVLNVVKS